jgi:hypothetical protein
MVSIKQRLKAIVTKPIDRLIDCLESESKEEFNNKSEQDQHDERSLTPDYPKIRRVPSFEREIRQALSDNLHGDSEQSNIEDLELSDIEFKTVTHLGPYKIVRSKSKSTDPEKYDRASNQKFHLRALSPSPKLKKFSRSEENMPWPFSFLLR